VSERRSASARAASALPARVGGQAVDADIVRAIAAGELRRALSACARAHGESIGRLCFALSGSAAAADELTEQTLLSAYRRFTEFRGEGSLRGWLLAIARRHCVEHLEVRRRRGTRLEPEPGGRAQSSAQELSPQSKRAERARKLLERVRPSDRQALLLRYLSGLSFRDVGLACGIDEGMARQRASDALIELRIALANEAEDE
jgi:RNA polymerase sigma-70 factor, ECF subfamily